MKIISGRNVNELYMAARSLMMDEGELQDSRAGAVLALPYPVCAVYEKPLERVLFDPKRDGNPFFHVAEGIWMLSGSADARMLDNFIKGFSARYTEDWGGIHGAYGARWRRWFKKDQLKIVIDRLKSNHQDRRIVLSMWDAQKDCLELSEYQPFDLPCNLLVIPRIVGGALDITTVSRSHDVLWGALGANAVHFTMLQEYLAAGIGVPVGKFYQFSNNYHVYTEVFEKTKPEHIEGIPDTSYWDPYLDMGKAGVQPYPMVTNFAEFDRDVAVFLEGDWCAPHKSDTYVNRWFADVLTPVVMGGLLWRAGQRDAAMESASTCEASDWRLACQQWMERRNARHTK